MIKNVAIVSLSSGIIGEKFVKHEVDIGLRRLKEMGLNVIMMPHAQKGLSYVKEHPEDRAADLIAAFKDPDIDMIFCAIGGDDTYRLLPYLFDNGELEKAVSKKIFLGFSDTTMNHYMLHKVGLDTFYGQSFFADTCELDHNMLEYTEHYFRELITTGTISEIRPSKVWYDERTDWSEAAVGTSRVMHENEGFQLLQGPAKFSGKIMGGCLETTYDMFDSSRYPDTVLMCTKYSLFPTLDDWKGKILLIETSEERPSPDLYRNMLTKFKNAGVFDVISGIICGKPQDEVNFEEYKKILVETVDNKNLPIVYNINIGHATPRCIIPFGVEATVDAEEQVIRFAK